jgi:EAL domain-containing protein (putative c-di-GMP-specific phosphodiesterase class I)/anti-sigma regulatory factor (Ser/Thr protein kinase)
MNLSPGVERRRRVRRLSDVRPPTPPAEIEARTTHPRRATVVGSLASLGFALLIGLGFVLSFEWSSDAAVDRATEAGAAGPAVEAITGAERAQVYLVIGLGAAILWLLLLPLAVRLARAMDTAPRRGRRRIVRAIRRGIERGEFELHYQPQLEIDTGVPSRVEALLRWRRRGELVAPAGFLADAEASSVIRPLTNHVLDLAVSQAAQWRAAGRPMGVAVNLSAANLRDFSVVERLERLLEEHGVPAETITLEVTETAVLEEPELARAVLQAAADLGCSISIDDFGTGYSSLLWLRLFPVDEVKIDRTFVDGMSAEGEAYVAGVIRLGHDLGVSVVAEGVEDEATLKRLQELGCDVAQGYLFARPLPPGELEAWISEGDRSRWLPDRKEISVSSDPGGLDRARELIQETAAQLGFDENAIWEMKLAATEALTNAIDHGPQGGGEGVHLRLAQDNGDMLLEVWGGSERETSSNGDASSRGRGIAVMTALMDNVELVRNADETLIRLAKRRSSKSNGGA